MTTRRATALGCLVLVAACSLPNVGLWSGSGKADTGLYRLYGERIAHGRTPYRPGFTFEFPPGAIPPLAVPALPGSAYIRWFKAFELLCAGAAVAAVAYASGPRLGGRQVGAVAVAAASPALLGEISLNSFDLWPAALAAWAVALVARDRPRLGLGFAGAATAAKLYPVLLVPPLLVHVARTRGRAQVKTAAATALVVAALAFVPFAVAAPGGVAFSLREQATRGLQVESLGGSVLGSAHRLGTSFHVIVSTSPFSFDIAGRTASAVAALSTLLLVVAAIVVWLAHARGAPSLDRLLVATAACAVSFVAFGKVLSPQYLLFLVPLVPLAGSVAATALFVVALGLTQVWARFPEPFLQITHLGGVVWVALARNLVLVVLYVVLALRLRTSAATRAA